MKLNTKIYFYFLLLYKQHKGQEYILDQENKINHCFIIIDYLNLF